MDYGLLNIGSVLFGLVALVFPIINLMTENKDSNKNWIVFSGISMGACSIALCMQILYTNYLVNKQDWSAMMDLLSTVSSVSVSLFVATIVLNVITYFLYCKKESKI